MLCPNLQMATARTTHILGGLRPVAGERMRRGTRPDGSRQAHFPCPVRRNRRMIVWSAGVLCQVILLVLAGCSVGRVSAVPVSRVSIGVDASAVVEGTPLEFTVSAAPAASADLLVNIELLETGAMLMGPRRRAVTIPVGSEAVTLTVSTDDDQKDEPGSTVTGTVTSGIGYALGITTSVSVLVTDDDAPEPPVDPTPTLPVVAIVADTPTAIEGEALEFTVSAGPPPGADLVVPVIVTETGTMLVAPSPPLVTLRADNGSTTLTVSTANDSVDEPASTVSATLTAGAGYTLGLQTSATVTVADDDDPPPVPVVTIAAAVSAVTEGMEAQFTVSADPPPATELSVSVTLAATAGSSPTTKPWPGLRRQRNTATARTVTIPSADSMTTVMVTIGVGSSEAVLTVVTVGDDEDQPDRALTATLSAGSGYTVGTQASATVTVLDDDEPAEPPVVLGFAYVAYDLTGLRGTDLATDAAPEVIPPGTLPISFSDRVVVGAEAASGNEPATPGTVTTGQCVLIVSATHADGYAAFGSGSITYSIDLQGETDTGAICSKSTSPRKGRSRGCRMSSRETTSMSLRLRAAAGASLADGSLR